MACRLKLTTCTVLSSSQRLSILSRIASTHTAAQILATSAGKTTTDGSNSRSRCPYSQREASTLAMTFDEAMVSRSVSSSKVSAGVNSGRGYDEIPSPKSIIPFVGTWIEALRHGVATRVHEYVDMRYRQLGPIYREKLGKLDAVFIFDPQDVQRVFMREGRHPRHVVPEAWLLHQEISDKPRGLFFM